MKNSETDKSKFISSIIESIRMNTDEFMYNLVNGEKYECLIYEWSVNLFYEGKSIKDAIETVQKRRMSLITNSNYVSSPREDLITAKKIQWVMRELKSKPIYNNLNEKQKASIQSKIDALVESGLRFQPDIVKLVLGIINQNFATQKWKVSTTKKSEKKPDNDSDESTFLSKFERYINPKIRLNETLLRSSQLS